MKKNNNKNIIIVGSGKLGMYIANDYSLNNNNIILIDKDDNILKVATMRFGGKTISGDATNLDTLLRAGIKTADVVIAATNDDNVNIYIALIAKEKFKIKNVISRLYDESRAVAYEKLGIVTVCPSVLSAEAIKAQLAIETGRAQGEEK